MLSVGGGAAQTSNPHNSSTCLLCHTSTPRFGVDTKETVSFRGGKTYDDPSLCAFCHKAEDNLHPIAVAPGPDMLATETPSLLPLGENGKFKGTVVCTTCHFYHAADSGYALLRGFPGSQKPGFFEEWQDFCRDCHGDGLVKRSPHGGDEQACLFCHQNRPETGMKTEVLAQGSDLCNFCHGGVQDGHFARANPFEGDVECVSCHNPHLGAESASRLKEEYRQAAMDVVTIDPHYRKTLCFACHKEGEGYPLRIADPVELCNRCHGSELVISDIHPLRTVPDTITPPEGWPLKEGALSCLTCHLAGHEDDYGTAHFLRGGPYSGRNDFCVNCHDMSTLQGRNPHADINAGKGCDLCHTERPVPGKDTIDSVRLLADPNILCLRCHEPEAHPSSVDHTMTISSDRAAVITELPLYGGSRIVCATCHNPHIEEVEGAKLRGNVTGTMICTFCHKY